MRWSPVLIAASLVTLLPRLAAAQPAEPAQPSAAETTDSDADAPAGEQQDDQDETAAEPGKAAAAPPAATAAPEAQAEPEKPPIEPALDTLGGHVSASPSAALALPFGDLAQGTRASDVMGAGSSFGLELGYGTSRSVVVGAWGEYNHFGAGSGCTRCSASSFAVGPFVRYHLVQGVRFDPWMEAALGFRSTHLDNAGAQFAGVPQGSSSWSGIQWVRLSVGGDWYAFSKLGIGPFMSLGVATYGSRPSVAGASAAAWQFSVGARFTFDLPGK